MIPTSHETFREAMADDLEVKLYGPASWSEEPENDETLRINPLQQFATGVLFPQQSPQVELEDPPGDEIDEVVEDDDTEVGLPERRGNFEAEDAAPALEPLNLANEFSPSAAGLSFRIQEKADLTCRIAFATYTSEAQDVPTADGIGVRRKTVYRRRPVDVEIPVSVDRGMKAQRIEIDTKSAARLSLRTTARRGPDDTMVVSAMLVNDSVAGGKPTIADTMFQVFLEIRERSGSPVFLPIDRSFGNTNDHELREMQLLFRHRRAFALGHGIASDWNHDRTLSEQGGTDMVRTAALPRYEVKPVDPRVEPFGAGASFNLAMGYLFDGGGAADPVPAIIESLGALVADYAAWIDAQDVESKSLTADLRDVAAGNVEKCRTCAARMERGIALLKSDAQAMLAFRLMNKAMFVQQHHSRLDKREPDGEFPANAGDGHDRIWRPFQLGFILMNLCSVADLQDDERELVELIWFPTGGGKTEAYLGLAAFTIILARLRGEGAGTTVLMRYTLRLLTAQQFQRASALILSLECLRRDRELDADLGIEPISIGLWVGESLTPNRRAAARTAQKKLNISRKEHNPFQVLRCPWCGADFLGNKLGYRNEKHHGTGEKTVIFRCPDDRCRFGGKGESLPILLIDDDIYERPPTLLIGTVDKFAQIAWEERTGRLFGIGTEASPPVLVIQDELHLISGPLGTIVGLYETAINHLCSRDGHVPKIVASTATIRRAAEQCRGLYARECFEFPQQAVRANESYFAYEARDRPGRLYIGFMGNAVSSHQTAMTRAAAALLQFPCRLDREDEEVVKIADPYGTLVWYFNTLRELGHAATLCVGDIPEFLKGLCARDDIPPSERRHTDRIIEMTSRRSASEIPEILDQLEREWRMGSRASVDVLLATNMISVGVDVDRLGLMMVAGQPKGASEYIQATSRVGRRFPGLVVVAYTQSKNRDRSHYERFTAYHQSLYRFVEPTSVTPFSPQARQRGARALLVALARLAGGVDHPGRIVGDPSLLDDGIATILARVRDVDADELNDVQQELAKWAEQWRRYAPAEFGRMGGTVSNSTLMYPYGSAPDEDFQSEAWPVLTSMRNVDSTSVAAVLDVYPTEQAE